MKRVLIVEDDADSRRLLGNLLRLAGYAVTQAGHGRQALVRLRRRPRPCLILLDLGMPVMSGRELLQVLQSDGRYRGIPVVLITAETLDGPEPGTVDLLRKPFETRSVLSTVARHCA